MAVERRCVRCGERRMFDEQIDLFDGSITYVSRSALSCLYGGPCQVTEGATVMAQELAALNKRRRSFPSKRKTR